MKKLNEKNKTSFNFCIGQKNLKFLIKNLNKYKIKLISSGGTYKEIKKMGFSCEEVSKYTSSPEILSGRVKTLTSKDTCWNII